MNTGHDGSLSTGHGNSPKDMLSRLETMVLMGADIPLAAVRSQVSAAIDVLIHLGWLRDKSRRVLINRGGSWFWKMVKSDLTRFISSKKNKKSGAKRRFLEVLKKWGVLKTNKSLTQAGIEL